MAWRMKDLYPSLPLQERNPEAFSWPCEDAITSVRGTDRTENVFTNRIWNCHWFVFDCGYMWYIVLQVCEPQLSGESTTKSLIMMGGVPGLAPRWGEITCTHSISCVSREGWRWLFVFAFLLTIKEVRHTFSGRLLCFHHWHSTLWVEETRSSFGWTINIDVDTGRPPSRRSSRRELKI